MLCLSMFSSIEDMDIIDNTVGKAIAFVEEQLKCIGKHAIRGPHLAKLELLRQLAERGSEETVKIGKF